MNRTDAPKKQPIAFGVNGPREDLPDTTPSGDNTASYNSGFPPITMTLKSAGGLPPKGQDMNQILYELSNLSRWASSGAMNTFDLSFATAIGGYPAGAFVLADDLKTVYRCTANGNSSNPNSVSTGWAKVASDIADILALGTAAYKNVGTGSGQIPDMSSFTSSSQSAVFSAKNITGNYRVMEGIGNINFTNGAAVFTMPLAFPSSSFTIIFTDIGAGLATYAASPVNGSTVNLWGNRAGVALNGSYGYKYIAVGVI